MVIIYIPPPPPQIYHKLQNRTNLSVIRNKTFTIIILQFYHKLQNRTNQPVIRNKATTIIIIFFISQEFDGRAKPEFRRFIALVSTQDPGLAIEMFCTVARPQQNAILRQFYILVNSSTFHFSSRSGQ